MKIASSSLECFKYFERWSLLMTLLSVRVNYSILNFIVLEFTRYRFRIIRLGLYFFFIWQWLFYRLEITLILDSPTANAEQPWTCYTQSFCGICLTITSTGAMVLNLVQPRIGWELRKNTMVGIKWKKIIVQNMILCEKFLDRELVLGWDVVHKLTRFLLTHSLSVFGHFYDILDSQFSLEAQSL